jgi:hypothetical protein
VVVVAAVPEVAAPAVAAPAVVAPEGVVPEVAALAEPEAVALVPVEPEAVVQEPVEPVQAPVVQAPAVAQQVAATPDRWAVLLAPESRRERARTALAPPTPTAPLPARRQPVAGNPGGTMAPGPNRSGPAPTRCVPSTSTAPATRTRRIA